MKKIFLLLPSLLGIFFLSACTTFFINQNGQLVFGRNYDWVTDAGMVNTNQRGLIKTSMPTNNGKSISWISNYGSITFNQYGKEFPTGGMNEKGLVVELMWLDVTVYPSADDRPAIGVLQWIQYQLDNSSNIDEVIATDKILRIGAIGNTPLHYLIADANGNAATIEFLSGKMIVHKGATLSQPVLTNSTYEESLRSLSNVNLVSGNNSLERFQTACNMIKNMSPITSNRPLNDQAFEILDKVAQGSFTKWSIVYDPKNKMISFKTNRFREIKNISFSSFDFSCAVTPKSWDMNQKGKGSVDKLFGNFNNLENKKIIETAINESSGRVTISNESKDALCKYPEEIKCK